MELENPNLFFPGDQIRLNRQFERELKSAVSNRRRNEVNSSSSSISSDSDEDMILCDDKEMFGSEKPLWKPFDNCEVKKGEIFDVLSLLSRGDDNGNNLVRIINGHIQSDGVVQVDYLNGKYILLCCVLVPQLIDGMYANLLKSLSLLSRELSVRSDVEMVLVIKVRPRWSDYHSSFVTQFVSTFSCLAVPFDHHSRIDSICMSLNMGAKPTGVLVDPNQIVIRDTLGFVSVAGMDAFPFTDSNIRSFRRGIKKMKSLDQLLASNLVPVAAPPYRICNGKLEVVSVSELRNKLVGLYLYITGDDMSVLKNVYRQCQARGLEFEVVVFCMPFHKSIAPEGLERAMASVLRDRKLPWWVFPFNSTVFRRLHIRSCVDVSDRLFIVLPNGKLMEPHGELVVRHFGVDAYPFTRESMIMKALDKLRGLTLETSLLGGVLYRGGDRVSVDHLRGRNVLLCLDWLEDDEGLYLQLSRNYHSLKAKDPQMEVVYACLDTHISRMGKLCISYMPWLVYIHDPSKSEFVAQDLFPWGTKKAKLVAFGKDGRISSIHAKYPLCGPWPAAFPFSGNLVEEIFKEMNYVDRQLMFGMVWSDRSLIGW